MASIRQGGQPLCGGSIIRQQWILTSAYCVKGLSYFETVVVVGTHRISTGGVGHLIRQINIHPDFKPSGDGSFGWANDIALVQVTTPFSYNEFVQPIQISNIPTPGELPAVVAFWGYSMVKWHGIPISQY